MKIKSAADYDQIKDSIVTIGTFDGVHLGHQKIINQLVAIAKAEQLPFVATNIPRRYASDIYQNGGFEILDSFDMTNVSSLFIIIFDSNFSTE